MSAIRRGLCMLCLLPSLAWAEPALELEAAGGPALLDPRLDAFAWDTGLRPGLGLGALLDLGALAVGVRGDVIGTTQAIEPIAPRVRLTRREALLRLRLLSLTSTRLSIEGSYGRTRVAFDPDRLVVSGNEVELHAIDAPSGAFGLGLAHAFGPIVLGLHGEQGFVHLATAHRRDAEVIESEVWFSNRRLLLSLGWRMGL